jgi:hypothetical protein
LTHAKHRKLDEGFDGRRGTGNGFVALIAGALRRIGDAISGSRQEQAEREIAHDLTRSGGRLTDDIERRMMRHLWSSSFSRHE